VKKLGKSAKICQSYERMYSGAVFRLTVYMYLLFSCCTMMCIKITTALDVIAVLGDSSLMVLHTRQH